MTTASDTVAASISPVEAEIARIHALLEQRRHAEALAAAEALSLQIPDNRDALYMVAVSHRYLNQIAAALEALKTSGKIRVLDIAAGQRTGQLQSE